MLNFKIILLIFIALFTIFFFYNLERFVDISTKATKADIIVSLGGDQGCRLRKALKLYQNGFSTSQKLIYTGNDSINKHFSKSASRYNYLKSHGVSNIVHINGAVNTMEELFYIKKYMLKYHYTSALFVSHPFHSRRIITLANSIAHYKDDGLHISVVSCQPKDWDKDNYYKNKKEMISALSETVKLVYNLIKYSPPFIYFTNYYQKEKDEKVDKFINSLK